MTADRTDDEQDPGPDPDARSSSESTDPDDDSLTIPRVSTEDAGSGLWSDLKTDLRDEGIDPPGNSSDVSDPLEPSSDGTDVDLSTVPNDLLETFIAVVVAVNGAVLAVSLGILFLVFDGATTRGVALLVGGLALAGFAVRRYRAYQDSSDASESKSESESESESNSASAPQPEPAADTDPESGPETGAEARSETETGTEL